MVAGVPQDERAEIDAIQRRLTQKYVDLPHDRVAAVVHHAYARFDQSRLRDFVPLLVERRANDELAKSIVVSAEDALASAARRAAVG
jgi:CRISPR/Cas system-associated exonuclease Cas4 (RecB family)